MQSNTTTSSRAKPSGSLADYVWLSMATAYGHRWTSAFGDDPRATAGRVWATALADISRVQIDEGLKACITSADPWPPTLPEFRAKCLGIPTLAEVRLDTARRSPFVALVWRYLDNFAYRQANAERAERMLREAYELARTARMQGLPIPDPIAGNVEQAKRKPTPARPEVAAGHIAMIHSLLGRMGKDAAAGPDR